jgi:hypothetical protein
MRVERSENKRRKGTVKRREEGRLSSFYSIITITITLLCAYIIEWEWEWGVRIRLRIRIVENWDNGRNRNRNRIGIGVCVSEIDSGAYGLLWWEDAVRSPDTERASLIHSNPPHRRRALFIPTIGIRTTAQEGNHGKGSRSKPGLFGA